MNPFELPTGKIALVAPPQTGALFVAQALVAANPGAKIKDFSTRPTVAAAGELEALECPDGDTLLAVLHSGGSGREIPDANIFAQLFHVKPGWPPRENAIPRSDLNGSEVQLIRPGHDPILMHRPDNSVTQAYEVYHGR